nr:PREDICTED: interleukin-25 [Equus przewalskii]
MYQVVVFLAMVMGTPTLSLWHKECTHWPSCCPKKGQDPIEEWLKWSTAHVPPPETANLAHHPESCRASEDGPLNSRSISPWRYDYHNQTVFYRRPCPGKRGAHDGYCLERRLYRVSLACVCVRPRVMA